MNRTKAQILRLMVKEKEMQDKEKNVRVHKVRNVSPSAQSSGEPAPKRRRSNVGPVRQLPSEFEFDDLLAVPQEYRVGSE